MITLCNACGTSYEITGTHPHHCKICEDERQFVPVTGQKWIDLATVFASRGNNMKPIFSVSKPFQILRLPSVLLL